MKKEIIYSSGNYLRDEFKIEGYLFGKQSEGSEPSSFFFTLDCSFNSFLIISKEAVDKTTTSFDSYYLLYVSYA